MDHSASLSVLIRTFNSAKTLDKVLNRLALRPNDEVIIVDSGSTDGTLEIAKSHNALIYKSPPPFNYSRTLNEGFRISRNPWVLVLSSHCIPNHDSFLDRMREAASLCDRGVAVLYGISSITPPADTSSQLVTGDFEDWSKGRFHCGGNVVALYLRSIWQQHPFDEDLVTAEDMAWFLWAVRAGYHAATVPNATVLYRNQGSLGHMFRKGWHETRVSFLMLGNRIPHRSFLRKIYAFVIHLTYLSKALVLQRISPATFLRQIAHITGSFAASLTRFLNQSHEHNE